MNIKTIAISSFLMIQTSFAGENNANNNEVALAIQGDNLWRNVLLAPRAEVVVRIDYAQLQRLAELQALAEQYVVSGSSASKAEESSESVSKS